MEKLTKKEFFEKITGSRFIDAIWNHKEEEVNAKLLMITERLDGIYTVARIEEKSNCIWMIPAELEKERSRRDFQGKNNYYIINNFLVHHNYSEYTDCFNEIVKTDIFMINQI